VALIPEKKKKRALWETHPLIRALENRQQKLGGIEGVVRGQRVAEFWAVENLKKTVKDRKRRKEVRKKECGGEATKKKKKKK